MNVVQVVLRWMRGTTLTTCTTWFRQVFWGVPMERRLSYERHGTTRPPGRRWRDCPTRPAPRRPPEARTARAADPGPAGAGEAAQVRVAGLTARPPEAIYTRCLDCTRYTAPKLDTAFWLPVGARAPDCGAVGGLHRVHSQAWHAAKSDGTAGRKRFYMSRNSTSSPRLGGASGASRSRRSRYSFDTVSRKAGNASLDRSRRHGNLGIHDGVLHCRTSVLPQYEPELFHERSTCLALLREDPDARPIRLVDGRAYVRGHHRTLWYECVRLKLAPWQWRSEVPVTYPWVR